MEQILDVDLDPSASIRVLSNQVNLIRCPHCGSTGAVNLPFLYHDASKELALVYVPMEAGRDSLEQQQIIGTLSRLLLNQMPPEQRKGYLLNPQIFFTYESLLKKVREAEGITEEMIAAQQAKVNLFRQLVEAGSDEERAMLLQESGGLIDEEFFGITQAHIAQVEAIGHQDLLQKMIQAQSYLLAETTLGRELAARSDAIIALKEQPTREKLVELLVDSDDAATRQILIRLAQPMIDYIFFQQFTRRIEATKDAKERQRLEELRKEVLQVRDDLAQEIRQEVQKRAALINDLLSTEKPALLARRRLDDIDEIFLGLLEAEIDQARQNDNQELASRLEEIWRLISDMAREQMPPELLLLNQLLESQDLAEARRILEENRALVQLPLVQALEQIKVHLQEQQSVELSQHVAAILEIVRSMVDSRQKAGKLEIAGR
ncbi:MAG: hypothetical protein JW900_08705 [Anaerolineae bacterium]|nr:hypothetical protein [Anaerolineae bacterium]